MDVQITRSNEIFLYDVQVHGYDTNIIKALTGTPTVASNKLRLNAAEICTFAFFRNATVEFLLTIPAVPTASDVRAWGLKDANSGNKSRVEFDITGTAFTAKAYDEAGTIIESVTINWSSAWTATETRFKIKLSERNVFFLVGDTIVARIENEAMTKIPLFAHVINSNADNVDLASIAVY